MHGSPQGMGNSNAGNMFPAFKLLRLREVKKARKLALTKCLSFTRRFQELYMLSYLVYNHINKTYM